METLTNIRARQMVIGTADQPDGQETGDLPSP